MDHPNYRIITVADFQQVPDDRLEACLMEFVGSMLQVRPLQKENLGMESFTWVDDGVPGIESFDLKIGDKEENIPNPHFPRSLFKPGDPSPKLHYATQPNDPVQCQPTTN